MRGKIAFVLGATAGYVLGARAGRARYEQIKRGALKVWNTDTVQRGVKVVRDAADDRADDLKAFARRKGGEAVNALFNQSSDRESRREAPATDVAAPSGPDDGSATA